MTLDDLRLRVRCQPAHVARVKGEKEAMTAAVRAEGLCKTYGEGAGEVHALDDVDFSLEKGSIAALLGPSGSGKSTLIKALGFVSPADRGSVWFDDRLVVQDGKALAD